MYWALRSSASTTERLKLTFVNFCVLPSPPGLNTLISISLSPTMKADRERLGLSARDYGLLVGVAGLTIYNWEKGKSKPRDKQLAAWAKTRRVGKREAWRRLELLEG